ncbi:thiol-activated cytolysin family protein [Maribacter halichondriae]|uniref:thiol-activated cytolysin family protein n=1 Tax=Maribacter halichondriae TaxID=2980554 RepID=UPI0023581CC1|nr:thiol-activated cytolysin family protein [Maribacter sp. Hal144]
MKTRPITLKQIILGLLLIVSISCSKESGGDNPDPIPEQENLEAEFSKVVTDAGDFEQPETSEDLFEEKETNEVIDGEVWNCTTKTYDALRGGGTGRDGFPLFNPNASVIYPGSLLQGKSLKKATPDVIAVERAGGTVSYNLNNGNLASSFAVDKVAKSSIQDAMNNIIANAPQDLPANFSFNYSQVQSRQALALSLGVDFENAFAEVSADFDFSTEREYNRILVELKQNFYTMSFDIPTSLKGLFADSVTPEDLAKYVQAGNPATYISDVSYGRIYYMLVESTSTYTEMNAAVEAEFNAVAGKTDVEIDASYLNDLSEVKIKVMAFGGESESTIRTIGGNLSELVDLLAESSTISTGLPLSYVVRSVNTNQIVGVQLATKYDVTECTPASGTGGEPIHTAHWKGQVLSRMGAVGAAYCVQGTEFVLISADGKEFMRSANAQLEGPFPIEDLYEGEYPFGNDGIGAACNTSLGSSQDTTIMFMSQSGLFYNYVLDGQTWRNNLNNIENLAAGDNPFAVNGIGAIVFRSYNGGPSDRYMINRDGTQFSRYSNNPNQFNGLNDISEWGNGTLPFESVGAGIGFDLGNNRQYLLFNKAGTQYVISNESLGWGFIGPFDL